MPFYVYMHSFFDYLCTYKYIGACAFSQRATRGMADSGQGLPWLVHAALLPPTRQLHILFHLCNIPQSFDFHVHSSRSDFSICQIQMMEKLILVTLNFTNAFIRRICPSSCHCLALKWTEPLNKNCNLVSCLLCSSADRLCKTHRRWYPCSYG